MSRGIVRPVIPDRVIRLALLTVPLAGLMSADGYRLEPGKIGTIELAERVSAISPSGDVRCHSRLSM